jgi:formylmethanofuran dehydrogenase subunit E
MATGTFVTTGADRLTPALAERPFADLLEEAVRFHGHLCPGQVLGVRMALAGCRELGIDRPRSVGKRLVVFVEIDRCATDAIQALTGVSIGKRTLKHLDYGKMAATFADVETGALSAWQPARTPAYGPGSGRRTARMRARRRSRHTA